MGSSLKLNICNPRLKGALTSGCQVLLDGREAGSTFRRRQNTHCTGAVGDISGCPQGNREGATTMQEDIVV
jgi:hypothetical protein